MELGTREEWNKRPVDLISDDWCHFCDEWLDERYTIWEWEFWRILVNKYPYTWDIFHILLVPKKHYEKSTDVPSDEWKEISKAHKFIEWYFGDLDYFSFTRETFWSRSLKHLHIHFIRWNSPAKRIIDMIKNY